MDTTAKERIALPEKLNSIHFDLRLRINKIKFYKDQLDILQSNLDQMVKYYAQHEVMTEVEQYQNKFIVYREVADRLIKDYKLLRNKLTDPNYPGPEGNGFEGKFNALQGKTEGFVDFIEQLKDNFLYFYTSYYISDNHVFGK